MPSIAHFAVGATLLVLASASSAAEFVAKSYHDSKCTRCHDTTVYTRENRRVHSYAKLETQVERCDANLGTKLFPDDLDLLVDHLNDSFYKFDK